MRHVLTLSALALCASLTLASAQVRSQSIVVAPAVPVAPAVRVPAALAELVRQGGAITLTDAQGRTVATVGGDGTVTLVAGMTLGNATAVRVRQGTTTTGYPLAVRVDSSGQVLVALKNADGRTQVVPLLTALNSAPAGKKDDGRKAAGGQTQDEEDGQQRDGKKDGKHDGKKDGGSGRGNGHR